MNIGIVLAGGTGSRIGMAGRPKQFLEVGGKPIIIQTLEHFEHCPEVDGVIVVCLLNWIEYMWDLIHRYELKKVWAVVPGGATGQESIYQGLLAAQKHSNEADTIVLMHDAVRPFISPKLLTENIHAVQQYGSSITCSPVTETIARTELGCITGAYTRQEVRIARAPQCFWLKEILAAHEDARAKGKYDYLDSCSLMLRYKPALHFVEGGVENIKITEFEDVYLMQAFLRAREDRINYAWGAVFDV